MVLYVPKGKRITAIDFNTTAPAAVTDGMAVERDHVYVIPPPYDIAIADGGLELLPRRESEGPHMPIDLFLRTLAATRPRATNSLNRARSSSDNRTTYFASCPIFALLSMEEERDFLNSPQPVNTDRLRH